MPRPTMALFPSDPRPEQSDAERDFGRYAGLGLTFVLTLVLCGALGLWLDTRLGSSPWLLVAGVVLGSVVAFYQLVRSVPPARSKRPSPPTSPPRGPKPPSSLTS